MNAVDIHAENLIRIIHVKKLANLFTQSLHGFLVNISVVGLPVAGFLNFLPPAIDTRLLPQTRASPGSVARVWILEKLRRNCRFLTTAGEQNLAVTSGFSS